MNDKFTIRKIESIINEFEQFFRFFLYESPQTHISCRYSDIKNILVTEVEILVGSFCKPVYFNIGDKLISGKVINERNRIYNIKKWDLLLNESIDKCRSRNQSKLLNFETIKKIGVYQTKSLGAY